MRWPGGTVCVRFSVFSFWSIGPSVARDEDVSVTHWIIALIKSAVKKTNIENSKTTSFK
jgi:hypothetical protein